jgi:DNA-binding NtrC family response regulator
MQSSRPCILIVDDDKAILLILETYLARFDFEILLAVDADDALSTLAKRTVHAVVSDYNMPRTNGLELAVLIKQQYPHILVFILSGSLSPPEAATAPIEGWYMKAEPLSVLRDALTQRLGKQQPHHSPKSPRRDGQ